MSVASTATQQIARRVLKIHGVAGRYAHALWNAATEVDADKEVNADLEDAYETFMHKDVQRVLNDRFIPRNKKKEVITALCDAAGYHEVTTNFFGLLAENNRFSDADSILDAYWKLVDGETGTIDMTVTAHETIPNDKLVAIAKAVMADYIDDNADVNVKLVVDPSILGGYLVEFEGYMLDASLSTRLGNIEREFKKVVQESFAMPAFPQQKPSIADILH